jgi:hypothetical protein
LRVVCRRRKNCSFQNDAGRMSRGAGVNA